MHTQSSHPLTSVTIVGVALSLSHKTAGSGVVGGIGSGSSHVIGWQVYTSQWSTISGTSIFEFRLQDGGVTTGQVNIQSLTGQPLTILSFIEWFGSLQSGSTRQSIWQQAGPCLAGPQVYTLQSLTTSVMERKLFLNYEEN